VGGLQFIKINIKLTLKSLFVSKNLFVSATKQLWLWGADRAADGYDIDSIKKKTLRLFFYDLIFNFLLSNAFSKQKKCSTFWV
jgi:hypothetical protein